MKSLDEDSSTYISLALKNNGKDPGNLEQLSDK